MNISLKKKSMCRPYYIQGDVGVVKFAVDAVVVQGDDVVQLRHWDVNVGVVVGVQGDPSDADSVGEEQVRLRRVVT